MNNYFSTFHTLSDQLEKILAKKYLVHEFAADHYPITLTIRQNLTPDAQMAIYDSDSEEISSRDATMQYTFTVGCSKPDFKSHGRWVIDGDTLSKIDGLAKKMYAAYVEAYFAERRDPEAMKLYGDPDAPAKDSDEPCEE